MTDLSDLLSSSFHHLWKQPRLFIPKLASTFLSSVWLLGALSGYMSTIQVLATFPIIAVIGVFASLMVASMVENTGSDRLMEKGFIEALGSWRKIVPAAFFFILAGFLVSVPLSIGIFYYLGSGEVILLAAGAALTLLLVLLLGFLSYFLPITLLRKESFISGFRTSMESSHENSRTVFGLIMLSIALLGLAAVSSDFLQALGYAGFLVGRLVAATVNTYLFVVSPKYYLEEAG